MAAPTNPAPSEVSASRGHPDRDVVTSPPEREPRGLWILVAAAFTGALGESGVRLATREFLDRPTFLNPESVWLGPLLNLAVLAIPAVLLYATSSSEKRDARLAFLALCLVALELLLLLPGLSAWASLLFALGVASSGARAFARWPTAGLKLARRLSIVLVSASACLAGATAWSKDRAEQRALSALPPAAQDAPNVILVVLDAVRARSLSLYGNRSATSPFLSQFASRCVTYRRAIATAPWTLPSHGSMFTGQWPRHLTADWSVPLEARDPTVAERMAARGYATGAAVGNYLYTYREFGLSRGFAHYDDYGISLGEAGNRSVIGDHLARAWNALADDQVVPGRKNAARVTRDMLRWIDANQGRPYFVFMNWYDAHDPYDPPGKWQNAFTTSEPLTRSIDDAATKLDSATVDGLRRSYLGSVGYLDSQLDSLVRQLQQRGTLDRTLLIITADHGEEFAEHGRMQHGYTLYYPAVHVPLLICPPAQDSLGGRTVAATVSLRDLGATMLARAGQGQASEKSLPGYDLLSLATDAPVDSLKPCRSPAISFVRRPPGEGSWYKGSTHELSSIVDDRFHLVRTDEGREELYDVVTDPLEQRDLIGTDGTDSVATRLRQVLVHPEECLR